MSSQEKKLKLVKLVYDGSQKGKVTWEVTASSEAFQASFPSYFVGIQKDEQDYHLDIMNEAGEVVERVSNSANFLPPHILQNIYELARSKAMKSDEAIDDLIDLLSI
ncbi:hypothetical protein [Candidatus Albibeggiatoa sp. nov. NOAA]|uniref:hypothetical protein n=1 Tax=Candidatus Albibeggiatoa sp. nov. NOAA TaxID=3162724 RepID=UPI003301CEFE|nr:hypothetical protein [Thiotrichaceae bacterium]